MGGATNAGDRPVALVAFDGSPAAADAISIGARLLPAVAARIVYVWTPPFASAELRRRLLRRARNIDELIALVEREGASEAERLADEGVTLARAAGWAAEPLIYRSHAGEGFELARLAETEGVAAIVLGSRGLSGVRAALGSTSDSVVNYSPVPVLVVPRPMLLEEREAAASGPVLVGHDGSDGARTALDTAASLFAGRDMVVATVADEPVRKDELDQAGAPGVETVRLEAVGVRDSARAIADALARCAAERGAALIAVGSRGRSPVREILLGSVAIAVLHHAHRPVLVVPRGSRLGS
jgi:nucleotide-binding universal stress UspA family protein